MKHTALPFRTLTLLVVLSSAVFFVGCDDDSGSVDAGALDGARYDSDVSNSDSGLVLEWSDAGVDLDAGPLEWERDGGDAEPDGGTTDDAAADSGVRPGDSGATDAGAGPGDSGATDSGAADTGRDAATVVMDSGPPDSGVDAATPECVRDSQCDDMIFCNGVERCSSQGVCTVGAPPECADTDACTIDSCSTTLDQCVHLPRACDLQNAVAACTQGACRPTECSDGFADCNAVASDGCEVALDTDSNCGSCGNVCFTECQNKRCRPGRTGEPCGRDSDCESGDCRARQCVVAPSARLSATDSTRSTVVRSDGLTVEMRNYLGEFGGVRSETAIAPGQGVFYFEVSRLSIEAAYGFGVMTGNAEFSYQIGQTDQSFGFTANRAAIYDNTPDFLGSPTPAVGFVIDYRGSSPVIYALLERFGTPDVYVRAMPNVTTPLYAAFMGLIPEHGPIVEFNFGNDTTNHPFYFDPDSLLRSAGSADVANALVLGFGQTRARVFSNPPTLNLSQTMLTVPVGTPVMVTGSATDVEDGDLTASIRWELESDSYYLRRSSTGSSFSFTPEELGIYPVVVRVTDSFGVETTRRIMVTATGALPQFDPVQLVRDEYTGDGITLGPDALRVHYSINQKNAIRANQGLYGRFWYFEVTRFGPARNVGCGAVIRRGSLNPLDFLSTQPSVQVNFEGSAWRDLIFQANVDRDPTVGFAIDYTGIHPHVYVIVAGGVAWDEELDNVWVPFYPITYGNVSSLGVGGYDQAINFGASAFAYDARSALAVYGVDTSRFEQGWGDANLN